MTLHPAIKHGLAELHDRGLQGAFTNAMDYAIARWALRNARCAGFVKLRGHLRLQNDGDVQIGHRVRLDGRTVRIELVCAEGGTLTIGDGTFINYGTNISAISAVTIGKNCDIGQYAIIMDCDYHSVSDHRQRGTVRPVRIDDDVWLGARAIVLKGSHIGRGAVIGANSVVHGEIPPYTLAVGSPARVIRSLEARDAGI